MHPAGARLACRVVDTETGVEPDQDEVEVDAQTHAPVGGHRLPGNGRGGHLPDVARLGKDRALQLPESREAVLDVRLQLEVAGLARDAEARVHRLGARAQRTGLPAAHAVGAAAVELLLEGHRHGVAVGEARAGHQMHREGLAVVPAQAEDAAQVDLGTHVLLVRQAEDGMHLHRRMRVVRQDRVEQREGVAGQVQADPLGVVGRLGHDRRVGRVVEHQADAGVDLVLEGIPQIGIGIQRAQEVLADGRELHHADPQGIDLIEIVAPHLSRIAEVERGQQAHVFRPVLVVERDLELRPRDVVAPDPADRVADQARDAQRRAHTELRRGHRRIRDPLPVAGEAQVEPLAAVEDVLVEEVQLGREAQQAGGVDGAFQVDLEAQLVGPGQVDVDVHRIAVGRARLDGHVVEDLERGQPVVGRIDHPLVVGRARTDPVVFAQQRLAEADALGVHDVDLPDAELADRFVERRVLAPGVAADAVVERGPVGQRVGLEEVVVLVEAVVAQVAEHGGAADGLGLEGLLGEVVPRVDGDVGAVGLEGCAEIAVRHVEDDRVDRIALAGLDDVSDAGQAALVVDLPADLGAIVADRGEVGGDVVAGALDLRGVEDHGRGAHRLPEAVDALAAAVGPVVDGQGRAPAEDQALVGLLADVGVHLGRGKLLPFEGHLIGHEAVGPIGQQFCSTARDNRKQRYDCQRNTFHLLLNSERVTAVAAATLSDSAPDLPKDGMVSRASTSAATAGRMPLASLPITTSPSGCSAS